MHAMHGFELDVTAWAIEAHVLAMFLPSLFSGALVVRLGPHAVMAAGVAILAGAAAVAWVGQSATHYVVGLILLGVGWNFLFTAGSTLITTTYRPTERFKAQGLNDLIVFGTMAVLTLAAGALLELAGLARTAAVHAAVSCRDAGAPALHAQGDGVFGRTRPHDRARRIAGEAGASVAHRPHPGP